MSIDGNSRTGDNLNWQTKQLVVDALTEYGAAQKGSGTNPFSAGGRAAVDIVKAVAEAKEGIDFLTALDLRQMEFQARTAWGCYLSNEALLELVAKFPGEKFFKP